MVELEARQVLVHVINQFDGVPPTTYELTCRQKGCSLTQPLRRRSFTLNT